MSAWTPDMLPNVQVLEVVHPGDSGCIIPSTASGYMCHPTDIGNVTLGAGSGRGHPGDCEHVTPGIVSGKWGQHG